MKTTVKAVVAAVIWGLAVMAPAHSVHAFTSKELWLNDFGYNQSWRVESHPRALADVNGDGRPDVVGFGHGGVWVSLAE